MSALASAILKLVEVAPDSLTILITGIDGAVLSKIIWASLDNDEVAPSLLYATRAK